ncbi:MAG: hypothetical protein EBR88_03200 [Betaproteobacteria bacterium]|nr:hypothetical protein [Betaproteobacteria bacterium]
MIQRLFRLFSIGDPRWGRQSDQNDARPPGGEQPPRSEPPKQQRPGSEPPDLDEVWRDFNRKLGGLFGGKGQRGRGPRNPWGKWPGPQRRPAAVSSQQGAGGCCAAGAVWPLPRIWVLHRAGRTDGCCPALRAVPVRDGGRL